MQCGEGEESRIRKNHTFAVKVRRKESTKEGAEVAEKRLEGDEQCGDAERMDVTVV